MTIKHDRTYTHNMRALGLPRHFAIDFLEKHASIAHLTSEHLQILTQHIESLFDEPHPIRADPT